MANQLLLVVKVVTEELLTVPESLLHILGGADSPCPDAIRHLNFGQFGAQIHLWITDRSWFKFHVGINVFQNRHWVIVNTQHIVYIDQYVGIVWHSMVVNPALAPYTKGQDRPNMVSNPDLTYIHLSGP